MYGNITRQLGISNDTKQHRREDHDFIDEEKAIFMIQIKTPLPPTLLLS